MIRVESLTKVYGKKTAVSNLSFELQPGTVTGFLGPNGSGKSTTMRCIVGLDRPTSGRATINGVEYHHLKSPLTTVGALLDGKAFHAKRSARQHLRTVACTHGFPAARVEEVLALTGLLEVADRKVGGFSLGMSQRLGIATALLGDPDVLLFDEPVNGLDPDGVRWIRTLMRSLANQGRTVLVSSHLMSEMALTADTLIIIGRGQLIDSGPMEKFTKSSERTTVILTGSDVAAMESALRGAGLQATVHPGDASRPNGYLTVAGAKARDIGALMYSANLELHELSEQHSSLEDVFMELTQSSIEYSIGAQKQPVAMPSPTPALGGTPAPSPLAAPVPVAPATQAPTASAPAAQPAPAPAPQAPELPAPTQELREGEDN
ncbi:MAG: ATP-binding cassette domain-containing protein [Actinomycetaceae bacterium]|nr:ATP-binding cassette domain-containing protein [Actinomycetaceae bacterium]